MSKEALKLSDKQIQQTLGGIEKKRKVKIFRNSLAFPYNKTWPAVNLADAEELIHLLEKLLPEAKISSAKPIWKDICKLSKEERKKTKANTQVKTEEQNVVYRSFILPGYSAVTRGLEKGEICCCILAEDVEPHVLIKNIVSLAQNKKVPVVIIPSLKSVLQKTLNFSAMALGFKVVVEKEPNCIFYPIFKCIVEMNKKLTVAEGNHLQMQPLTVPNGEVSQVCTEENHLQMQSLTAPDGEVSQVCTPEETRGTTNIKINYHLLVTSPNGPRVFVPPREHKENGDISSNSNKNSLAFISLGKDDNNKKIKVKSSNRAHLNDVMDEESDDDDIDCKEMFKIDTQPDNLLTKSWEETKLEPSKKKRKISKKLQNPVYQPTKIKVIKSNPMKSSKKKKKKNGTNI